MKKRLLAVLLVIALAVSLMTTGVMADADETTATPSVNTSSNGITINKYVSGSGTGEDPYMLTLEAYASNTITVTPGETTPLDIVLVLDVSGSMDERFGNEYTYTAATRTSWTVSNLARNTSNGYNSTNYYVEVDGNMYQVYVNRQQTGSGYWSNYTYTLYYRDGSNYEQLGTSSVSSTSASIYYGTLYQREQLTRLQAMKNAVTAFINSVEEDATNNNVEHRIAIVTFSNSATTKSSLSNNYSNLISIVNGNGLSANGSTYSDDGLEEAQDVLDSARDGSKRVVVMFTDGVPGRSTSWTSDSGSTAAAAITAAYALKNTYNATVYTVGIFAGADPSSNPVGGQSIGSNYGPNTYMHAVSSNYPNAQATGNGSTYNVTLGNGGNNGYYLAASDADELEDVFEGIAESVTSEALTARPDDIAVLSDTLSEYFNFPDGLSEDTSDITVKYVPVNTTTGEFNESAATDQSDVTVSVDDDNITFTGFNYYGNAVTKNADGTYSGGKLVVTFPIVIDAEACGYTDGIYPTNKTDGADSSKAGLYYKKDAQSEGNDTYTVLNNSPSVDVDGLGRQGTAINIEVYVDETKIAETESVGTYVTVTPDNGKFNEDGDTVTYTFTYYDCKDIGFTAKSGYVIEAIDADLVYGQSGCRGIYDPDGASFNVSQAVRDCDYVADNVQGGSTVNVYLRTEYTAQFHDAIGNVISTNTVTDLAAGTTDGLATSAPTLSKPEVGNSVGNEQLEQVGDENTHAPATASGKQPGETFTFVADLDTTVTMPSLPTVDTGYTPGGWFLGSTMGEEYEPEEKYTVNAEDAVNGIIHFYSTSTANKYAVEYEWTDAPTSTVYVYNNSGEQVTISLPTDNNTYATGATYEVDSTYTQNYTVYTHDTYGNINGSYTFSGWKLNDSVVTGSQTMGTEDVTLTGSWSYEAQTVAQHSVSYNWGTENVPSDVTLPSAITGLVNGQSYTIDTTYTNGYTVNTYDEYNNVTGTYTFSGWTDPNNGKMGNADVTVTGSWSYEPQTVGTHTVTIQYISDDEEPISLYETATETVTHNATVDLSNYFHDNDIDYNGDHYRLTVLNFSPSVEWSDDKFIVTQDVTVTYIYSLDNWNDEDDSETGGDDIPDRYQALVTYKVVGGTWSEKNTDTVIKIYTIYEQTEGRWHPITVNIAEDDVPNTGNVIPSSGYQLPGTWDDDPVGDTVVNSKVYTYTLAQNAPSVVVTKTVDEDTANVGELINYTVTVTNNGNVDLTGVKVTDSIWKNGDTVTVTINNGTAATYTVTDGSITIDSLAQSAVAKITYSYTPTEAGTLTNSVVVDTDQTDPDPTDPDDPSSDETTTTVTDPAEPSLSVTKSVSDPAPAVGQTITYTIVVTNTGNTNLTGVTVTDTFNGNGELVFAESDDYDVTGSNGVYTIKIGNLAEDASVTITATYRVLRSDAGDRITNAVAAKADGGTDDDSSVTIKVDPITPSVPSTPVEPDIEYVPKWLNTTDHYAYIIGYEDGSVRPNGNITRAEVATIFFRLLTDDARADFWSRTNDYSDVAADAWYNNAVSTLSNAGIINGYEDGTFRPNDPITRAEFTAIATRFFDYTARYAGSFNDVSYSAWYADCVQAAVDMGLVDGYPDGGFHPSSYITRAEACTIVNRVLGRIPHEDHLLSTSVMNTWPDNVYGAWYYADMQEATNSHDYDWIRVSGEVVEDWTEKLPERDWEALEKEWSTAYSG